MNIYEKIARELKKNPRADAFAVEEKLGMEEVGRVKSSMQKNMLRAARNPHRETYPYVAFQRQIERRIAHDVGKGARVETPPEEADADFAIPCFFLAKEKKKNPHAAAQEVAAAVKRAEFPFVLSVAAVGGYANVKLRDDALAQETLKAVAELGDVYGASQEGKRKIILLDYSHPNVAKPMSVGHLRSTIIGASLKRLYEFQGYAVIGINHLGDFGTQFGKLLVAYERWRDDAAFKKDPIKEMLRLYVKFHEEAEKDLALEERAREAFKKLEEGDPELVSMWLEFCIMSVSEFDGIYRALGVDIDLVLGESFYQRKLAAVIERSLKEKAAVKNDDGSVAVNFEEEKLPSYLLQKKDGSSLYATRDIAAAEFRLKEFAPEKIIYVVGGEQTLHFKQVFATLERLGHDKKLFRHDPFGLISLPEGKMSTREGRAVFLEDLIEEAKRRAYDIVSQKNPELSEAEKKDIARAVGIGAVIYSDLSQSREKDIIFTWEKALSLEGASAPYLQYVYARAMSILRKAEKTISEADAAHTSITTQWEAKLIRRIARFPETIRECTAGDHPHILATYLNALAQDFNRFYNEDSVLNAEGDTKTTRLLLVSSTAHVIKNGLHLLGIKTLERM
ncbi:arginine--tRNA ligase [Candidatus Azambacteria bacterium]|nr:arginine--tRNA ligase [Candidatus Azambacteria bacterium]MBI3685453.1 arginine--tRNA ligase [Candidatus Azambacteria bacterium]